MEPRLLLVKAMVCLVLLSDLTRSRDRGMNKELLSRIGLCVLSGFGVGAIQQYGVFGLDHDLALYPVSGLVFAAGVLFPLLKRDDGLLLRALMLVIASTISYYVAVTIAAEGIEGDISDWISFTAASVVGAAIVLTAFIIATPTRASRTYVLLGLAAGVAGGPITMFTLPGDALILVLIGHATWHTLILLAIYLGATERPPRD